MSFYWRPYVPVAQRRSQAMRKIEKLKKKGIVIQPIEIEGRKITSSFWGKAWCDHLESFSDYDNRLPRGRTYVRNGSVCHLEIKKGKIEAIVSGSELYNIAIDIRPLKPTLWKSIKNLCSGKIGSMLELLQGRLSDHVMGIVTHRKNGLMPQPGEIKLSCSCPDWADMCKHVAAVMYGVGSRLDSLPELLFTLRGVDATELISASLSLPTSEIAATSQVIANDRLSEIFDIEMEKDTVAGTSPEKPCARTIKSGLNKKTPRSVTCTNSDKPKIKTAKTEPQNSSSRRIKKRLPTTTIPTYGFPEQPHFQPTAKAIILLRIQLGLSVAEFAERVGVSPATIYNWQKTRGRMNLRYYTLNALTRLNQECVLVKT